MIFLAKTSLGKVLTRGDGDLVRRAKLDEGFDMSRKELGEIPFRASSLKDNHIKKLILDAAAKTNQSPQDILEKISTKIKDIEKFKTYSPILYDTIARDAVSQAAFDLVEHAKIDPNKRVNFDVPTFFKLIKMIELEHDQFFPLRAPGEVNYIFHIDPILVPTNKKELIKFNQVTTAAATADGEFIFNVPFMQKLMDWAVIENLKPRGRKYVSNGGDIPDCYTYIEFLIMHELLHYSYGDFSHGRRLDQYSHKLHNWASDFRSNYMLVKNGYDQLPIGLFSDHINYDRQGSYDEMIRVVSEEFKKLPKPLQDIFKELSDLDEHPDQQDGKSEPGDTETVNVGDIVQNDDGSFGKVKQVNPDGSVVVDSIPDPSKGGK